MNSHLNTGPHNNRLITGAIFNFVRGFFGWLALSPMVYAWGLLVFILFATTFVNFQDGSVSLLSFIGDTVSRLMEKYPYLEHLEVAEPSANKDGGINLGGDEFKEYIFKIYAMLTTPFVLLGAVIDILRGPTLPRPMHIKLKYLAVMSVAAIAILFINFFFGSETYHGSVIGWSMLFILGPGIVYVISLCSLYLSHIIRRIGHQQQTTQADRNSPRQTT